MMTRPNYLFALSFLYRNQSGVALVTAHDDREALSILKRQGSYNGNPSQYAIERYKNLGLYDNEACTLIFESYTNAKVAYDAIVKEINNVWKQLGGAITSVSVNGTELVVKNSSVNIPVPTNLAQLGEDDEHRHVSLARINLIDSVPRKIDRVPSATPGNIVVLDEYGNIRDGGKNASDIPTDMIALTNMEIEQLLHE